MIPVVISTNGIGLPVREVDSGAPTMIVAENGFGIPIVMADFGIPFVVIGATPTIAATAPTLAALVHGDTLSGAVTWGSATPPEGETLNAPVREMNVGAGWVAYDGDHVADYGETIRVRETWTTVEGSGPVARTSAAQSVSGIAPTVELSADVSGRVVTFTAVATGVPTPVLNFTGTGGTVSEPEPNVWTVTVPSSASATEVTGTVTATGWGDPAVDAASVEIPADLFAPVAVTAPYFTSPTPAQGETVDIVLGTYSSPVGGTINGVLTLDGVDVTGDMVGLSYEVPESANDGDLLVWTETATSIYGESDPQSVTATVTDYVEPGVPLLNIIGLEDGTAEIEVENLETIRVVISSGIYAGTYDVALDDIPGVLVPLAIQSDGDGEVGDTLSMLRPSLALVEGDADSAFQWQLDGENITGETDPEEYVTEDAGPHRLRQTITDDAGSVASLSNAIDIDGTPVDVSLEITPHVTGLLVDYAGGDLTTSVHTTGILFTVSTMSKMIRLSAGAYPVYDLPTQETETLTVPELTVSIDQSAPVAGTIMTFTSNLTATDYEVLGEGLSIEWRVNGVASGNDATFDTTGLDADDEVTVTVEGVTSAPVAIAATGVGDLEYIGTAISASYDPTSADVTGVPIGDAASDRVVYFVVHWRTSAGDNSLPVSLSVVAGGDTISADLEAKRGVYAHMVGVFRAIIPAGTTATCTLSITHETITLNNNVRISVFAGRDLETVASNQASANSTSVSANVDTSAGGWVVSAVSGSFATIAYTSPSGTERVLTAQEAFSTRAIAWAATSSAETPRTITWGADPSTQNAAVSVSIRKAA